MALHTTGNPHIMLSDVGTFRCFTAPYVLGMLPYNTFNSFAAAEAWVQENVTHRAPTPIPNDRKAHASVLTETEHMPSGGRMPSAGAPAPMSAGLGLGVQAKPDLDKLRASPYNVFSLDGSAYVTLRDIDQDVQSVGQEEVIKAMLSMVAPDPLRQGLMETPHRVVKAWKHWTSGYEVDIAKLLKVFEDGAENYDQMVIVKDIPIYSKCEHHLADIFGTATIAYIPNGKIVGLSKLSRLADAFARRLQVQERLTAQIADALVEHLDPIGVGVIVKARHMCMESRGICQQGHHTITSALRGAIKDEPQTRAEFLAMTN